MKCHMPTWSARTHPRCVVPGARPCTGWKVTSETTTVLPAALVPWEPASISVQKYAIFELMTLMTDLCVLYLQRLVFRRPEPDPRAWLQKRCLLRINIHMTLWVHSCHSQDLEILRDDGVAAAWWTWSRHFLQQFSQVVEAGPVWISQIFGFFSTPHPLGDNEMLLLNMLMSQTTFQHLSTGKGENWHKQQGKYKDASFKDTFSIPDFSLVLS